jgi:hypothetical protein
MDAKQFVKQINECRDYLLKASDVMRRHGREISTLPDLASLPPTVIAEMKKYNQGEQTFEETFARIVTLLPGCDV